MAPPTPEAMFNELCKRIQDNLFKILVIGDPNVGKTSIIKQTALNCFTTNYRATIGVDFIVKRFNYKKDTLIRMQLWDVAGQERYGNMTRVYYKDAIGALLVFDVTRSQTFDSVKNWKDDLNHKVVLPDGSPIPCVILANKTDETKKKTFDKTNEEMEVYCRENGFAGWFETSAMYNKGIDDALEKLCENILKVKHLFPYTPPTASPEDEERFLLSQKIKEMERAKKKCKCN